jgi:hypothetical protein
MNVLTRPFDAARTGSNSNETQLTPQDVGSNLLVKRPFSLRWTTILALRRSHSSGTRCQRPRGAWRLY